MSATDSSARRLDRLESLHDIGQLPIRYAIATDARDLDSWVSLFVPDVQVGRENFGREALKGYIDGRLRTFRRSVHQVCGQRILLDDTDPDAASGVVYTRAEHEVGGRWIVMAVCYFDTYRRVEGEWLFKRRKERYWYKADINEHPQAVGFDSWNDEGEPDLPASFPTWAEFWEAGEAQPGPKPPKSSEGVSE